MSLALDADGLRDFLRARFPQAMRAGFHIDRVDGDGVVLSLQTEERHLRPGGTVSGPTLMLMADTVIYLAILAQRGPIELAVTTNLEMHFLRRPPPGRLVVTGTLRKLGRRLAVGTASLRVDGVEGEVAIATVTYSLPPGSADAG